MIRLEDLRVDAGAFALRIEELALSSGEYLVIVGPTGSGKTVLLDTIAGMRRPAQGRVWFGDRDVTHEPPERRRTGVVYQDYALFPHLTVAGNIGFGLRGGGTDGAGGPDGAGPPAARGAKRTARSAKRAARSAERAAQVERLASLLGIQGLLDRYPDSLSGGERQRVALARALAIEPEVLLLDEPLSALDRTTRRELRDELKRLHQELRSTVLHVTHDLDEALALGDRVAVLVDGHLRQVDTPAEVVRRPADGRVARVVGMSNVFPIGSMTAADGLVRIGLAAEGSGAFSTGPELTAVAPSLDQSAGPALAVIPAEEIVLVKPLEVGRVPGHEERVSNCNLLAGTITELQLQSVHACLTVDVPPLFSVHVLRPDVERMGLSIGSRVTMRIAPQSIHICPA